MPRIRLWYQSLTDLTSLDSYRRSLIDHLQRVAGPEVDLEVRGVRPGTYPTRYPGEWIQQVYLQSLHKEQFIEAALTAEESGFDGMVIGTIPDLGLQECRSLVDIPVVGLGEASFKVASLLGDTVGVTAFGIEHLEKQLRRNAERYRMRELLGPMLAAGVSLADVVEELEHDAPGRVIDAIAAAARELVAHGADVVIPGPGPMNLLCAKHGLARIDDVPVLDSIRATVGLCVLMIRMRQAGIYANRHGFDWHRPSRDLIDAARAKYGFPTEPFLEV